MLTRIMIFFFHTGLPNTFGDYDETPEETAAQVSVSNIYDWLYFISSFVQPLSIEIYEID